MEAVGYWTDDLKDLEGTQIAVNQLARWLSRQSDVVGGEAN